MDDNKEILLHEIDQFPHEYLKEVLDFIRLLKHKKVNVKLDTALASESSLKKDWLLPEEDEVWRNL